jgi:site-specific DNA-methyltransferase (adenine-specific)
MLEINKIYNQDCIEFMQQISNDYIDLICTSPPYAEQRKNQYGGINEKEYPQWTVTWMGEAKRILKPTGSVVIVIRPHIKNGEISDYVLKTRLALREDGWKESEELIWIKPDSPPLGSVNRPRRAWESILWFSKSNKPYCDTKVNGTESARIGFECDKFEHGGKSHIHAGQNKPVIGIARCKDYIEVGTSKVDKSKYNTHPAQYPEELSTWLIKMLSPENGLIYDPFMGSGTTAISALKTNRNYLGTEINNEYIQNIINLRLSNFKT